MSPPRREIAPVVRRPPGQPPTNSPVPASPKEERTRILSRRPDDGATGGISQQGANTTPLFPLQADDIRALRRRVLVKLTTLTSAAMEDLHADLLDGRLDVIGPGGLAWIEDMLTGRTMRKL
jgi:hypothetical protein